VRAVVLVPAHEPVRIASLIDLTPPWAVRPPSTGISAPVMTMPGH
jgi:hypothetical protein